MGATLGDKGLGNLAQSARTKQLKTARGILYFVGILTVVANSALFYFADSMVKSQFDEEVRKIRSQHVMIDEVKLTELRDQAVRSTRLAQGIAVTLGIVFIVCGALVYAYPVATTVTSLILYLGATAVYGVIEPMTLVQGWWIKILVVVALFKAVQAAIAYESERKTAGVTIPGLAGSPFEQRTM